MVYKTLRRTLPLLFIALILIGCESFTGPEESQSGDTWRTFDTSDGLPSNNIRALLADSQENLWAGTYDRGLMKFDGDNWTFFDERDGLPDFTVLAIEEDVDGQIWIGTFNGLSIYDGQDFYNIPFGVDDMVILDIHRDQNGHMWLGTGGYGVLRMRSLNEVDQIFEGTTGTGIVRSIGEDGQGTIWAGTDAGLMKIRGTDAELLGSSDGIPALPVHAVLGDLWNDVWIGFHGHANVSRYHNSGFDEINLFNAMPEVYVNDILEDSRGNIWFGLIESGVVRYNGSTTTSFRVPDGLPGPTIMCMEEDLDGNIWFGSYEDGLAKYTPGPSKR